MVNGSFIILGFSFGLELLIFSIPFFLKIPKKKENLKFLPLLLILYVGLGFGLEAIRGAFLNDSTPLMLILKSMSYLCNVLLLSLFGYFILEESFLSILILIVISYSIQHLTYDIVYGLFLAANLSLDMSHYRPYYLIYIPLSVIVIVITYLLVRRRIIFIKEKRFTPTYLAISTFAILFVIVMNLLDQQIEDDAARMLLFIYDLIGTALFILLFFYNIRLVASQEEKLILEKTWKEKAKYYEMSKVTIEELNRHYHDMKHLLLGQDSSLIPNEEINKKLFLYDHLWKTGNEALDVVLNYKSLYCLDHGITFSCIADGTALSFLSQQDIYILFGNILDNAVEAADKCDESNKKYIAINIHKVKGGVHISEENYFTSAIEKTGNSIKTTKDNAMFHGIGTKSIASIVKNHSGTLKYRSEDDIFYLDIYFPQN